MQTLSSVSLRCSFEIWLCRNSKSWSLPHPVSMSNSEPTQKKSNLNGVSAHNDHHACTPVYSVPSLKTTNRHCGIIIKGNTCYANVILQCLKVFPVLRSSNDQIKSFLYYSVGKIVLQLHSAKFPVDFFLNPIQDGEGAKRPPYQFFPCNFYMRRIWSPKLSDFYFEPFCHTSAKFQVCT